MKFTKNSATRKIKISRFFRKIIFRNVFAATLMTIPPPRPLPSPTNSCFFTLEGQINHKVDFVNRYVPADANLHFIGHSIGAKICVELVKRFRAKHNAATYLLFPTLERLAQTPNGRKIWPILGPLRKVVVFAASIVHRLPESWLATVVKWAIRKNIFTSRNVMCINYLSYVLIYIGYKVKNFTTADRAQILIYQQGKYLPVPN